MVDDGFMLNESRVMLTYLQNKYGKDDSLYPKDIRKRAEVDMKIWFEMATVYGRFYEAYVIFF